MEWGRMGCGLSAIKSNRTYIVVLVGSMRKGGNTNLLAQAFAEGAGKNNTVEIFLLLITR